MNPAVIARAIVTRLQADSTLYSGGSWTAALAGGASFSKGPPTGLSYPFIVFGVEVTAENYLGGLEGPIELTFTIFDSDDQGTDRLEGLIDRLIGDSTLASGSNSAPTYGLHNHPLALPSLGADNVLGASSSQLNFTGANIGPSDTVNVNQATLTFNGRVSKQATNV
jgi:hypothetical protein